MTTKAYSIAGMTCGHCVNAVSSEIANIPGVRDVRIDLVAGETSTVHVTSDNALDADVIGAAVDEAGYTLVA
jgi:copper chaperone CopZ